MHLIKPGPRCQDLEGIHLPSFRFAWKLTKHCRIDFFVFESWQTAEDVMVLPSPVITKPLSHQDSTLASLWRPWATVALQLQAKFSRDLGAG
jgi:hypothetical protein